MACQTSTLQALADGDWQGHLTVGELRRRGDLGLGTCDALDG
jgi:acetolactate decarboxylase